MNNQRLHFKMGEIQLSLQSDGLKDAIESMFADGHFSDVTLVSDDFIQTPAHKFILCAHSPFLKNILLKNKGVNPVIYLMGIKHSHLLPILRLMYQGTTSLSNQDFNSLKDVMEILKVNSLKVCSDDGQKKEFLSENIL